MTNQATNEEVPQWSDEAVAKSFRAEIQARMEAHNAAYRAREAIELEQVLREHPEHRGKPGFEVRDSGAWEVYQASEIRIDRNSVTIVLPSWYAVGIDLVYLFDHTTVAWSSPRIGATIVDGEARPTIEITLVATWTDAMDAKWRREGNDRRCFLVELYAEDIRALDNLVARRHSACNCGDYLPEDRPCVFCVGMPAAPEHASKIRERLELALVPLP
jgi:hypothetical protein